MGCASAKHVAAVQSEEDAQKGKNYQNGDVFGDEYRIKPVEEVKYMKNGAEEEQKIAARNQENLEKSASSNVRLKTNKEIPGLVHQPRANMHISESQQEFFRMLDEKIEKKEPIVPHRGGATSLPTVPSRLFLCDLETLPLLTGIIRDNLLRKCRRKSSSGLKSADFKGHLFIDRPAHLLKKNHLHLENVCILAVA
uniref:Uncharacterized protein n=2 Tax=Ursidae TaxID=9632 RepID=A0A452VAT0_URSMA